MPGPVLISSASGSGHPADEVVLAAGLRLLERGAWGRVRALSQDVGVSARAHPTLEIFADDELEKALQDARLLMVIGDLSQPTRRRQAALQVLQAKAAGVPVALVSVRLGDGCAATGDALAYLQVLAQAESITVCDSISAATMASCLGRRVATTAPIELVLSARPPAHAGRGIALENAYLESLAEHERQTLLQSVADFAIDHDLRATIVCAHRPPTYDIPDRIECVAVANWSQWMRALSQVHICIARPDSIALHLAVAQGGVPITQTPASNAHLSERIGLHGFSAGMCPASWQRLLQRSLSCRNDEVASRSAPLRVVAWRALGSLSEAVRVRPLELHDSVARSAVARVWQSHWNRLLDAGRFTDVEQSLERVGDLSSEPAWAAARARAWTLQGQDEPARQLLEETLTEFPQDGDCLRLLAMILWRLGDNDAAGRCWQRIIAEGGEAAVEAQRQWDALRTWNGAPEGADIHPTTSPATAASSETSTAVAVDTWLSHPHPARRSVG